MNAIHSSNIPCMTVGAAVRQLSQAYSTVLANGLPLRTVPSVMLWGPPGVGKSQAVRQIAAEIKRNTGTLQQSVQVGSGQPVGKPQGRHVAARAQCFVRGNGTAE